MPEARRRLDNIRGSWLAILVLACVGAILGLGLGSERVRRVVADRLPASLGGNSARTDYWESQPPPPEPEKEEDPEALPEIAREDSLRGIVRDESGNPVAGATVSAQRWRETSWETLASARTNREGRFVLGPVPRAHLSALAQAEGFASERKAAVTGAELEFTLKVGGTLAGKVVDAVTGDPVKGCMLRGWSGRGNWWESAETDGEGAFRFPSVPPGRVWLNVSPPDHREVNLSDIEILEGRETFKEIPVVMGGSLRGKVLDRETKVPVAGAEIRTWQGAKSAVSGEDGTYEVKSPPQGGVSLLVKADGYPEQWQWLQLGGDPSADQEKDILIGRGGKVSGVVVGPDGDPVAGARVGRDPNRLMTGVPEDTATTDAEGKFVLESVPAMTNGFLFAWADGFSLTRSSNFDVRSGTEVSGIRLSLQRGAVFKGTVKDEDGNPLPGVSVNAQRQWSPTDGGWFWIPGLVAYSVGDGTWEIRGVPQGNYHLSLYLEGYAPERRQNVQAPADGEVTGQDFVLRKGGVITGRVTSLDGQALQGASVDAWGWVTGSDGSRQWIRRSEVRTNEVGEFLLDGLLDGSYQVNVRHDGYGAKQLSGISGGTRDLQVVLEPTPTLAGRVFDADGVTPVPTFTLRLFQEVDAAGNPVRGDRVVKQQEFADREGKFELKDLPEGQFALVAVSGNKISRRLTGILATGGAAVRDLRLTVSEGGRLRVTVRDTGGSPIKGASVSAGRTQEDGSFRNEHWAQTDEQGLVTFAAMADGTWTVYADHQNQVRSSKTVDVGPGVDAELDMTLRQGGSALVRVTDQDGRPVGGATVTFYDQISRQVIQPDWGRIWQRAWQESGGRVDWNEVRRTATLTKADGYLLREGIPPGPIVVRAVLKGYVDEAAAVEILDGYEVDVALEIDKLPEPGTPAPVSEESREEEVPDVEEEF